MRLSSSAPFSAPLTLRLRSAHTPLTCSVISDYLQRRQLSFKFKFKFTGLIRDRKWLKLSFGKSYCILSFFACLNFQFCRCTHWQTMEKDAGYYLVSRRLPENLTRVHELFLPGRCLPRACSCKMRKCEMRK